MFAPPSRTSARNWAGIPSRRLDRSPYLLFGRATQMAEALHKRRDTYGLDRISLKEGGTDPVRFCREVLPLLSG
jgi:hypothetical protein